MVEVFTTKEELNRIEQVLSQPNTIFRQERTVYNIYDVPEELAFERYGSIYTLYLDLDGEITSATIEPV